MSMDTTHESAVTRDGKSYGYQKPQESAGATGVPPDNRQQVISAIAALIDGLVCRVPGTTDTQPTPGAVTPGGPTPGAPTPGAPTTTAPTPGASTVGAPTPGTPGGPAIGSVPTTPAAPSGGEAPTEAQQLQERSLFSQREAYRIDRERESASLARRAMESDAVASAAGAGVVVLNRGSMHQSDSNQSPLTDTKEFAPAFGALGKGTGITVESISVPSTRPETVPAPGPATLLKPVDAYWASYGSAVERARVRANADSAIIMESIIGTDDRVRVTNNQLYPWRCVCSLLITAQTGTMYIGTGWLVAPRLVLTAGHCVYMADEGGWARQIEVMPGRDGATKPFGSAISRDLRSVTGWTGDNNSDCDYGAILLPADKRFGEQLGWFGYAVRPDDYLRQITLNLSGYPGDGGKTHTDGTQWFHSRGVMDVQPRQITYDIDTFGGQSGAPVWEMAANGSRYGVAVHTHGGTVSNGATRITKEVFDNIVLWAGQAP